MIASGRLSLVAAATQIDNGDCDADGFIEPVQWTAATGGIPAPAGGGLIPPDIGAGRQDPWGSTYGYCVWDHGTQIANGGCGGASQRRLRGKNAQDKAAIAIISAGPDKVFQTTCANDPNYLTKPPTSDDLVMSYTYAEAGNLGGGLWNLKSGAPNTAEIAKNLEVKNSDGNVVFGVDSTTDSVRPAIKVDYIQKLSAARKGVEFLSNIIIGSTWLSGDGDNEGVWVDGSGNVGVGTNAPGYRLDVNGAARVNNNVDISQPAGSTGNRMTRFGYEDANNYFRILAYGTGHATLPSRVLIDNYVGGSNTTGGYIDFRPDSNYMLLYPSGGASGYLRLYSGGSETMRLAADSNVGIGATLPLEKLDVNGDLVVRGKDIYVSHDGDTNANNDYMTLHDTNDYITPGTLMTLSLYGDRARGQAWDAPTGSLSAYAGYFANRIGIREKEPAVNLHVAQSGTDADWASGTGMFLIGPETGTNLVMDSNEIFARNNGVASPLYIYGSAIYFRGGDNTNRLGIGTDGTATFAGNVSIGGTLAMGGDKITGVATPTAASDAATKAYVDANSFDTATGDARYLRLTGGTMSGSITMGGTSTINMGSSKITNLATPTAAADAATKAYVDSKIDASPGVPSGAVMAFALTSCPSGWSEYTPARGRFIRGIDSTGSIDPDGTRSVGNTQNDSIKAHLHSIDPPATTTSVNGEHRHSVEKGSTGGGGSAQNGPSTNNGGGKHQLCGRS